MLNMHNQTVSVRRDALLAAMRENLTAHRRAFAEATKDYRELVRAELHAAIQRTNNGDFSKVVVDVPAPESHEKDFLDVIEMMEQSVDETIKLDRDAFRAYFKNEWPWKMHFDALMRSYKTGVVVGGLAR